MLIVHVYIHVVSDRLDSFKAATLANVKKSRLEPGIVRFDFLEQHDEPYRFMLLEVYRTPEDAAKHKETAHYQTWRDTVAPMMATPRESIKYSEIEPEGSESGFLDG